MTGGGKSSRVNYIHSMVLVAVLCESIVACDIAMETGAVADDFVSVL